MLLLTTSTMVFGCHENGDDVSRDVASLPSGATSAVELRDFELTSSTGFEFAGGEAIETSGSGSGPALFTLPSYSQVRQLNPTLHEDARGSPAPNAPIDQCMAAIREFVIYYDPTQAEEREAAVDNTRLCRIVGIVFYDYATYGAGECTVQLVAHNEVQACQVPDTPNEDGDLSCSISNQDCTDLQERLMRYYGDTRIVVMNF